MGQPSRASRDKAALVATRDEMRQWVHTQEQRLRSAGLFDDSLQLEIALTLHTASPPLSDDVAFALTAQGVLSLSEVREWVVQRTDIFVGLGWPLSWRTRPPEIGHPVSGEPIQLPDDCIFICQYGTSSPLTEVFPYAANRDPAYEFARDHPTLTWQKHWWRMSDDLYGLFVRTLCDVWNCSLEPLLSPLERRDWSDCIHVDESLGPVPGYRFRRPTGT